MPAACSNTVIIIGSVGNRLGNTGSEKIGRAHWYEACRVAGVIYLVPIVQVEVFTSVVPFTNIVKRTKTERNDHGKYC